MGEIFLDLLLTWGGFIASPCKKEVQENLPHLKLKAITDIIGKCITWDALLVRDLG